MIMFWETFSGYYMYIETSAPRRSGDKARLISPKYPATSWRCMTFFYHMYGSGIGTLNIYLKAQNQLGPSVWTESGDHGNQWNKGQATINSNSNFQVSMNVEVRFRLVQFECFYRKNKLKVRQNFFCTGVETLSKMEKMLA